MLVQPTKDEGEALERPFDSLPIPSPTHPISSGGNHGGQASSNNSLSGNEGGLTLQSVYDLYLSLCTQVIAQAAEIKDLKAHIKHLKKKAKPVINHHKACFRASRLKKQQQKKGMEKSKKRRSVSKHRRKAVKSSKGVPSVATHPDWDDLEDTLDEAMDYTLAQDEGKTDKVSEKGGSTKSTAQLQCTDKQIEGTDKQIEGTDKQSEGTDSLNISTDRQAEGTTDQNEGKRAISTAPTMTSIPTPTIFGDDKTIAQVLITMSQNKQKEKEKGV
ncbi:hypothetical protein Tco_1432466 [Tanacetum coccineum]